MADYANPLEEYFRTHSGRRVHKWLHYFEIYHRHFERFRGQQPRIIEFGVNQGGSLQMWRDYFGPGVVIHGVDIDPRCKQLEQGDSKIFIGDQEDRDFLASVMAETGPVDIIIEDGGHFMGQQIATFEVCYPLMDPDGVFLIEDLHTSYWPRFGGGYRKPGTFMQYAKGLTDQLNAWHTRQPQRFDVDDFTRTTKSMHFYDSIVVFERGAVEKPRSEATGYMTTRDDDWSLEKEAELQGEAPAAGSGDDTGDGSDSSGGKGLLGRFRRS